MLTLHAVLSQEHVLLDIAVIRAAIPCFALKVSGELQISSGYSDIDAVKLSTADQELFHVFPQSSLILGARSMFDQNITEDRKSVV